MDTRELVELTRALRRTSAMEGKRPSALVRTIQVARRPLAFDARITAQPSSQPATRARPRTSSSGDQSENLELGAIVAAARGDDFGVARL